jgi:hypothetical protein
MKSRKIVRCSTALAAIGATLAGWSGMAGAANGPRIDSPKYGFAFVLPPGWRSIPVTGNYDRTLLKLVTKNYPQLAKKLGTQVQQAAKHGTKVFAIGPVSATFTPNVNIIVSSGAGAPPGNAFADAVGPEAKQQLTAIGATDIKVTTEHSRLGETAQSSYSLPAGVLTTSAPTSATAGYQIYALHKGKVYIVTISAASALSTDATAKVIKGSWKWTS